MIVLPLADFTDFTAVRPPPDRLKVCEAPPGKYSIADFVGSEPRRRGSNGSAFFLARRRIARGQVNFRTIPALFRPR